MMAVDWCAVAIAAVLLVMVAWPLVDWWRSNGNY